MCDEVSETCAKEIEDGHSVYKGKVNAMRKHFKKSAIEYEMKANLYPSEDLTDEAYSALVESLLDDEDDIEIGVRVLDAEVRDGRGRHVLCVRRRFSTSSSYIIQLSFFICTVHISLFIYIVHLSLFRRRP